MNDASDRTKHDKQVSQPEPVLQPGATRAAEEEMVPLQELTAMHTNLGNNAVGRWLRRKQVPSTPPTRPSRPSRDRCSRSLPGSLARGERSVKVWPPRPSAWP